MSYDYTALLVPVTRQEVTQFKRESRANGQPWTHATTAATLVAVMVGSFLAVLTFGFIASSLSTLFDDLGSGGGDGGAVLVFPAVVLAFDAAAGYLYIRSAASHWESLLRRTRFAAANELVYSTGVRDPAYPGLIFAHGSSRRTSDNYRSTGTPKFDLGNYSYTTGSGKEKTTHRWGYLALRLERKLPHMVLDARGNNGLLGGSTLPTSFRRNQRLSLEGDFDKYFTLYCPVEYERDALYVFTPDLMALLIDESAAFDVEIVDDWMFVYSTSALRLDEARTVNRLLRIIETVGSKTLRQTDRYADERIGDSSIDLVAPQGQRLKKDLTFAGVGLVLVISWVAFSLVRSWF